MVREGVVREGVVREGHGEGGCGDIHAHLGLSL